MEDDNGQTLGEILEGAMRQPPKRDSWEEYAIEKVQAFITTEEFFLEDQNGSCWAYGILGAFVLGVAVFQGLRADSGDVLWHFVGFLIGLVIIFACIVVRVHNAFLRRRLDRQSRQIDRFGVR